VDVQAYLAERARLVDAALDRWVPPADAAPAHLHAAMRHLLFPGGKRLRPALAFAGAEAVGAAPERALPVAAAVELVHTYSLVHDDLPCMDDDDERRGRPTVHVAYGEATAVLAGDALLALAFETLARAAARDPLRALAALGDLACAAGSLHLVGGQEDDLRLQRTPRRPLDPRDPEQDPERIESVHRRKTAALFRAAVVGGARLGGGDDAALARLARYAEAAGVAFQIADDLLDQDEPGDDGASLVACIGAGASRARAEELLAEALAALEPFGSAAELLRELARYSVRRDR
jgi:geranylgeranyl diphosphate synthase type II